MAGDRPARGDARAESIEDFMERRRLEVEHFGQAAASAAHEGVAKAIRAGQDLNLATPAEVMAYGAGLLRGETPQPVQANSRSSAAKENIASRQAGSPGAASGVREAALQADTAVRGAANLLAFGHADRLAAGLDALSEPGGLDGWPQRFNANLAMQEARNGYDASHRRRVRQVGQVGGTLLGLALLGPMEGALAAAPRLPGAAALTGRETAAILGAGGAAGLAGQTLSDVAAGGRRSSAADNAGAVIGGAAGAAALPFGPARAGAVGATVTSIAQDALNGRPVSLERAGENAITGNLFGGVAGMGGRAGSNALSRKAKGWLGEALGDVRSTVNGQRREWRKSNTRDEILPKSGIYWVPDGISGAQKFEDKFGVRPRLSPNQRLAQDVFGPNFQLYHFTPADIGKIAGAPASAMAPGLVDPQRPR